MGRFRACAKPITVNLGLILVVATFSLLVATPGHTPMITEQSPLEDLGALEGGEMELVGVCSMGGSFCRTMCTRKPLDLGSHAHRVFTKLLITAHDSSKLVISTQGE